MLPLTRVLPSSVHPICPSQHTCHRTEPHSTLKDTEPIACVKKAFTSEFLAARTIPQPSQAGCTLHPSSPWVLPALPRESPQALPAPERPWWPTKDTNSHEWSAYFSECGTGRDLAWPPQPGTEQPQVSRPFRVYPAVTPPPHPAVPGQRWAEMAGRSVVSPRQGTSRVPAAFRACSACSGSRMWPGQPAYSDGGGRWA